MLRLVMAILWPSFMIAILAEGCFFSFVDPRELTHLGGSHELSPMAFYTIGFFFFWVFCALASMLTVYLVKTPDEREPPF